MPAAPAHKLLLVDDHAIVRQGLAALLARETDFTVVAEAGTYEEGFAALAQHNPDCVILDLSLRDRSGLDWIRAARADGITAKILVLSMHDEITFAPKALQAGAQGYVMKDQAEETLVAALRHVLAAPTLAAWFRDGDAGRAAALAHGSDVIESLGLTMASDPDAARWLIRVIVSLLTVPGGDDAEERRLVERFVAPVVVAQSRAQR